MSRLRAWLRRQVDPQAQAAVLAPPDVRPSADDVRTGVRDRARDQVDVLASDLAERVAVARDDDRTEPLPAEDNVKTVTLTADFGRLRSALTQDLAEGPCASASHEEARLTVPSDERSVDLVRLGRSAEESHDHMVPSRRDEVQEAGRLGAPAWLVAMVVDGDRHAFDVAVHGPISADLARDALLINPDGTAVLA